MGKTSILEYAYASSFQWNKQFDYYSSTKCDIILSHYMIGILHIIVIECDIYI